MRHRRLECLFQVNYKSFYPIKQQGKYVGLTFGKYTLVAKKL